MTAREHALFQRYPLEQSARISVGLVPVPYHVYDGQGLFIGGTADLDAARALLAKEQVTPVATTGGRALMGVWIFEFTDASLGPHHELQFSIFASADDCPPAPAHRLGLIEVMLTRPEVKMLCHGLWNSTPNVVAYNRELLGLDARLSRSRIDRDSREFSFSVTDAETNAMLLEGSMARPQRPSMHANFALLAKIGFGRLAALAREPWIGTEILNPVGAVVPRNAAAESFTKADHTAIRYFDASESRLVFGESIYRSLGFTPQFSQSMCRFKFVYLCPQST